MKRFNFILDFVGKIASYGIVIVSTVAFWNGDYICAVYFIFLAIAVALINIDSNIANRIIAKIALKDKEE